MSGGGGCNALLLGVLVALTLSQTAAYLSCPEECTCKWKNGEFIKLSESLLVKVLLYFYSWQ